MSISFCHIGSLVAPRTIPDGLSAVLFVVEAVSFQETLITVRLLCAVNPCAEVYLKWDTGMMIFEKDDGLSCANAAFILLHNSGFMNELLCEESKAEDVGEVTKEFLQMVQQIQSAKDN